MHTYYILYTWYILFLEILNIRVHISNDVLSVKLQLQIQMRHISTSTQEIACTVYFFFTLRNHAMLLDSQPCKQHSVQLEKCVHSSLNMMEEIWTVDHLHCRWKKMEKNPIGTPPFANEQNHTNSHKNKSCNDKYIEQEQDYTKTNKNDKGRKTANKNK